MKIYYFLPLEERKLMIILVDGEPVNLIMSYKEIKDRTPLLVGNKFVVSIDLFNRCY